MTNKFKLSSPQLPICKGCYFDEFKPVKLSTTNFFVMETMLNNEDRGIKMEAKEIVDEMSLHISMPNAFKIFTRLAKYGRIVKEENPNHAISFIPVLTETGKDCLCCYKNPQNEVECKYPLVESMYLAKKILT